MRWRLDGAAEALRSSVPWIALSASLALTIAGWIDIERSRADRARVQFERYAETAEAAIRSRLLAYEEVLRAAAAHVAASPENTRREWRDFLMHLHLEQHFPGIQSVGYGERVDIADRAAHAKRVRAEGVTNYEIGPPSERSEFVPILFIEPYVGRNARLVGYDMLSDPERRAAMERARNSGDVAITGKLLLAGESFRGTQSPQAGFVMYVPVYRRPPGDLSTDGRAVALAGFVFSPFGMQDFMRGILDEKLLQAIDVRVFDGLSDTPANELLDTRVSVSASNPTFSRRTTFAVDGRTWTVLFLSRPQFDAALNRSAAWIVLASGIVASFFVFLFTIGLVATWNRAHQLSMRDPLTGLYNRRYVEETIGRELPRARRMGESVGVIAIDLDHFKRLNDTFGHDAGDYVLTRVADLLRTTTRSADIACRFGGEEFAVILPGASLEVARNRAEAIRAAIEALRLEFGGQHLGPLTISAGVASMPPHNQDWGLLLQQADRALYTAKQAGRNRVIAAVPE